MKYLIYAFTGIFFVACVSSNDTQPIIQQKSNYKNIIPGALTSYIDVQLDSGEKVEAFANCPQGDMLVGFGGKVTSGNFSCVTIYCRGFNDSGHLGSALSYQSGSAGEEQQLLLPSTMVAIGIGGTVDSDNLTNILIKACSWIPESLKINPNQCQTFGSHNTTFEKYFDVWNGLTENEKPKAIVTGAGMTATGDNISSIRLTRGTIKQ